MASSVSFVQPPTSVKATTTASFDFTGELEVKTDSGNADVDLTAVLYIGGNNSQNIVSSKSVSGLKEGDSFSGTLTHQFEEKESYSNELGKSNFITVEADYYGVSGWRQGNVDELINSGKISITVTEPPSTDRGTVGFESGVVNTADPLAETFEDRTPFAIREIEYEDDASYLSSIYLNDDIRPDGYKIDEFEYPNPKVSIDTAGRFAKHEIIGGSTVRQKIGEDPVNISINGVCKRTKANQIDSLRDARSGKIYSDRLPGNSSSMRVQFGSAMTEPIDDGGAADLTDGKYLYSFQLDCIEVIR